LRLVQLLFLIVYLCNGKFAFSQPDSILSLPREKQVNALLTWYYSGLVNKDSQQVITALISAEKQFAKKDNILLQQQAWLLQQLYYAGRDPVGEKRAIMMLIAADAAAQKNWTLTQAECWHFAGSFYFQDGKYTIAFEYMQKAQTVFDNYSNDQEHAYLHRYENVLGNCYYHFGEYREAIKYLKKTIKLPPYWNAITFTPGIYNTLALCYQQLKQYDSAAIWYNNSYAAAVAFKDSFYMSLAQGNLGFTYYLQQQYDKALPLLEADYTGSSRAGETGSATNAAITIAAIYIKKGQLQLADRYMNLSRKYVYSSGQATVMRSWYENLYNLFKAKADYKNASLYADSLLVFKDSVEAMRDKKAFNQAVLKLETEKHMNEVNQLEHKRKQQVLLRNSLLAGLVLLTLIVLLWLNRRLLKRNKEKELAQQQLRFAEQELINYTMQLKEKNDLLEQLRDEINKENYLNDREGNINRLLAATILTDDDWIKFRQLFEKVYPGFFIRLKEKMPDLSAADTRLLALTKLQLPPKNMASMLGVSYDAVKKARQRLRKKINLPEEGTLEELVEMIAN
jgi:tetratricopeptide (TPR) repeat protein